MKSAIYEFPVTKINGQTSTLAEFEGKWMVIVNVASECGFTPQYEGLQKLYSELEKNAVVLGFPCNQFGGQEKGTEAEIETFCTGRFGVKFPMYSKIDVNGENAHPLYQYLKSQEPGILGTEGIKWNFTKFLVSPKGEVVKRYAPTASPDEIKKDILSRL